MKVYVDFVYQFRIGEALLEYTGECHPRSRMEENFGPGGITARRSKVELFRWEMLLLFT